MSKAAIRLDMAVQTISTQVHELEKDLGHLLFKPEGRGLVLTEAGLAAVKVADQDRKSTRLNSSHSQQSRMPSSA